MLCNWLDRTNQINQMRNLDMYLRFGKRMLPWTGILRSEIATRKNRMYICILLLTQLNEADDIHDAWIIMKEHR